MMSVAASAKLSHRTIPQRSSPSLSVDKSGYRLSPRFGLRSRASKCVSPGRSLSAEIPLQLQRVGSLSTDELEEVRWDLVQKNWDDSLSPGEQLQLRLIEARLDAEDRLQNASVLAEESWLRKRQEEILSSIEQLVAQLRK